jgi:hypothetical protein
VNEITTTANTGRTGTVVVVAVTCSNDPAGTGNV